MEINYQTKTWPVDVLSKFPQTLQNEILEEASGADKDWVDYISTWVLESKVPVFISNKDLLKTNTEAFERIPQYVNDLINEKWGLNVKTKKVFDLRPERYLEYAKMDGATAKPSVMVNGEIFWGAARWVASLVRGDEGIYVWKIKA